MNFARWMPSLVWSVLAVTPAAWAQDTALSPQDIQSAWVDKTVTGTIQSGPLAGKTIEMQLKADGSIAIDGAIADTGTWRLSDNGYCATWKKIRAGQERCFVVVRKSTEQHVFNPDGTLNTVVSRVQ